jgi:NAD(P)-dependent dehydrogenase (short-subunit alcohol dehydrogenase family)
VTGELEGKVAIITGGASGIGKGCVTRFVDAGAKVVIADVSVEAGEAFAAELGGAAAFKETDVSDVDAVEAVVDFAVERFGGLHCMFNNAGISGTRRDHLLDEDFSDFQRVMAVNVLGVAAGTRAAARHMKDHGGGSIINTTSIAGLQAQRSTWAYGPSKAAVIQLSASAALDLGELGIRVNCIAPANIQSPILGNMVTKGLDLTEARRAELMEDVRQFLIARQPVKRQGTTDDIAEAAIFFASDRSSYMTGQVMRVDGGMTVGNPSPSGGLAEVIAPYQNG